jgi:hypothetical protein
LGLSHDTGGDQLRNLNRRQREIFYAIKVCDFLIFSFFIVATERLFLSRGKKRHCENFHVDLDVKAGQSFWCNS